MRGSNYVFSASELAFYPVALIEEYRKAGTLLTNAVEVTDDIRDLYNASAPAGTKLGVDSAGMPAWVVWMPLK